MDSTPSLSYPFFKFYLSLLMVDFRDPLEILTEEFTLLKFWHVVNGIYLWEYFITLDLEWDVIRGRRPHGWSFWIYSLARFATLVSVVINLVILSTAMIINCQVTVILIMVPSLLAQSSTTLLLALRTIAIWNKSWAIVTISIFIWVVNGAFMLQAISRIREVKASPMMPCMPRNVQPTKMANVTSLVTDSSLLIIMIVGLRRLGYHRRGSMGMGHFLWKQGIVWLFIAMVAGVIPVVFNCLNLNDILNEMFQYPWLITVVIAATRMYRALQDFSSPGFRRSTYESTQGSSHRVAIKGTPEITSTGPTSLRGQLNVHVHTHTEKSTTAEMSRDGSFRSMENQVEEKLDDPRELV